MAAPLDTDQLEILARGIAAEADSVEDACRIARVLTDPLTILSDDYDELEFIELIERVCMEDAQ